MYLGTLPADPGSSAQSPGSRATATPKVDDPPKPRFDFYTLLPQQTIEVEVDPGEIAKTRASKKTELYLLQAGSFKQRADADRRRAELLLLGLEPKIEETNGDNGRWFRVYVGPFESRSRMAKARSLTAAQDIDTLLLIRNKP
jgi:cell division protein FtsN